MSNRSSISKASSYKAIGKYWDTHDASEILKKGKDVTFKFESNIEEIRRVRDAEAAKYNYDVRAIMEAAMKRQKKSRRKIVSFIPKKKLSA